jgi:hypothetical protein
MKNNDRSGFTFYRSYYDILEKLDDESGYQFIKALLNRQFKGIEPDLSGMAEFAYLSQKHSIDKQVEGWENKTGTKLQPTDGGTKGTYQPPYQPPTEGSNQHPSNDSDMTTEGGSEGPYQQEKEKEKEKEQEQEQLKDFYKKNKVEIEYVRDMYNLEIDDAISYVFNTSNTL